MNAELSGVLSGVLLLVAIALILCTAMGVKTLLSARKTGILMGEPLTYGTARFNAFSIPALVTLGLATMSALFSYGAFWFFSMGGFRSLFASGFTVVAILTIAVRYIDNEGNKSSLSGE